MPNAAFLRRGSGALGAGTVEMAAPDPTAGQNARTQTGIRASITSTNGVTFEGRLSLGILAALIVALVLFYVWTRNAQGGG